MCRLLGIVALAPYDFQLVLCEAPRAMVALSHEHRDGWGLATHAGTPNADWAFHKSILSAEEDPFFSMLAHREQGRILIAHVRQKTVGPLSAENTHPFRRGAWVFAHNGTVRNVDAIRARTSDRRLAEVEGETDSELFFAYLMTQLDRAGLTDSPVGLDTDRVIRQAVLEAAALDDFGTLDALLSNGESLYAMRFGRPLYMLERKPTDTEPAPALSGDVPIGRRHCLVVASEPLTDEPWTLLDSGTLLRISPAPEPHALVLS